MTSSDDAEFFWRRFVARAKRFERRRDLASVQMLDNSIDDVTKLLSKSALSADEQALLRAELREHQIAARRLQPSLAASTGALQTPRSLVGRPELIRAEIARAKVRAQFLDSLSELEQVGRVLSSQELELLTIYRKFSKVMGVEQEDSWMRVFDYLAKNSDAVKAYRAELDRLERVIASETDPEKLLHLRDKALPATRTSGVHSALKGRLGEIYVSKWGPWRLIKSSYVELAEEAAAKLGPQWRVSRKLGEMHLGTGEIWDEAILLVRADTGEAKLFLAAQYKSSLNPTTAIEQTINDAKRETGKELLRIVYPDGREEQFTLLAMEPGETAHRWILNATGGAAFSETDLIALARSSIDVNHMTFPFSVQELNRLADALLKACADAL